MDTTEFNPFDATREQLIEYGREELGIDMPKNTNKPEALQLVCKQMGIEIPSEADTGNQNLVDVRAANNIRSAPKVKIRIAEHEDHPKVITLSINGYQIAIKPGAVVSVPKPFVELLRNMRQTAFRQHTGEGGRQYQTKHESPRYAFEVMA